MEPMHLGSAPSSPSSPGANPNYLPAFLMGNAENPPSTTNPSTSPERIRNYSYSMSSPPPELGNLRHRLFSPGPIEVQPVMHPNLDTSLDKPGPPKQSLFDTCVPNQDTFNNSNKQFVPTSPGMHDLSRNAIYNQGLSDMNPSLCRPDSFNNSDFMNNSDINLNLWVTVFGFPSSSGSLVLTRFASCGTILEKRFPPQGNWAHLRFSAPHEVAKALALNGKLISSSIMVGVVPYHTKQGNKENVNVSFTSPIRIRSLKQAVTSPQLSNSQTVYSPQNVPQKSTGMVTKAMEYVFGW